MVIMDVETIGGVIGVILGVLALVGIIVAICYGVEQDKSYVYDKNTHSYKEYKPSSITRYQEIEIGDSIDKTIEVLGTNYTRDLLSNGVVRLTWKEVHGGSSVGIRGSGMRFYNPQVTKKVVVKFKDNKVIELKANNL